jgi:choline dehydrogenase
MIKLWLLALIVLFNSTITTIAHNSTVEYDYIVVGSGPGGGPLAANLAKAGADVLLIEAGDDQGNNPVEEIAGWFFLTWGDPDLSWNFFVKYHSDDYITKQ